MLKSYFTLAIRSLLRRKGIAAINLTGLAVGLACCLLLALYVRYERSYDRSLPGAERVVRIIADKGLRGETRAGPQTPGPLAPTIRQDLPDVEAVTRLLNSSAILRQGETLVQERDLFWADEDFFGVFPFEMLAGDPAQALVEPHSLVLTASMADAYFGTTDAIGQTLLLDQEQTYTVTGIVADPPLTSSLRFQALRSQITLEQSGPRWLFEGWGSNNVFTYARLREGVSTSAFEAKLVTLVDQHAQAQLQANNQALTLYAEPLLDVYLQSPYSNPMGPSGNARNAYLFAICAGFILLLACVNYMNLATARSMDRAKEVAIRKTVGAQRGQVASQFFGESLILCSLAAMLALALVQLARPGFEHLTGYPLHGSWVADAGWLLGALGILLVVAFLAGSYPALVLARVRPARVLKGAFRGSARGRRLRQGLVTFQFAVSIALIASTAVVFSQVRYMETQDLGFETEQRLLLNFGGDAAVQEGLDAIKQRFLQHPDVRKISASQAVPGRTLGTASGVMEDLNGQPRDAAISMYLVDYDFIDLYDLEVVAGRGLSDEYQASDRVGVVINEAALNHFGYPTAEDALGKQGQFWGYEGEVVGVVRDFHQLSLKDALFPIAMFYNTGFSSVFTLELSTRDMTKTLGDLEALWQATIPQRPFDYAFLDEVYAQQYAGEQQFGTVFSAFAVLALFIACLGLVGLALFTTEQRAKEIGVRKVMGASVPRILYTLTRDIAVLVGLAFVVAVPVTWPVLQVWLNQFAYALPLGPTLFIGAGLVVLFTALAAVGVQAFRAARQDPLQSLRYE
ncbi:MAG: ABC transporter permease [Bacteroidota bacterium]